MVCSRCGARRRGIRIPQKPHYLTSGRYGNQTKPTSPLGVGEHDKEYQYASIVIWMLFTSPERRLTILAALLLVLSESRNISFLFRSCIFGKSSIEYV